MSLRLLLFALVVGAAACNESPPTASAPAPLSAGAPAPELEAVAHNGETVRLAELRGKPVVVYFYPKDNTPGCTTEAQEIRDLWEEIKTTGAVVLGVSTDDQASHQKFVSDHALPFLLLPDPDGAIARKFGVNLVKGRAQRVTFVIGKDGKIAHVFRDVKPKGHGAEILDALKRS
jgi:thioredoxin-dependent peroxiredoxin